MKSCRGWILLLLGATLGCGGQAFTTLDVTAAHVDAGDLQVESDAGDDATAIAPAADAGDEEAPVVMTRGDDAGDAGELVLEHDAAADVEAPPVADAGLHVCQPDRCAPCSAAQGYACCTVAGVCGCENPSQGGYCL
jgi:hypothetical protein